VAVESSTLSVGYVRELARIFRQKERSFLEAPVAGTRPQAEAAKLIFFVGGEAADLQRAEPALKSTAAAVHYLGPAGCGAVFKLAVNALLGIQAAALGELLPMLGRHGLELDRVVELLAGLPVCSPAASSLASGMARGAFAPQFPVEPVAKDFGYAVAAAGSEAKAPLTWQALQLFERAIAQGLGGENLTAIIKLQSSTPACG
jgi:3-hydroxyisobutyrate dehydrogenase-like beta-hydroxyacid dehydrogenase